ncbi:MAG: winged helix-turn-helix domain-containing protein [Cryomorphaceae bacterium]
MNSFLRFFALVLSFSVSIHATAGSDEFSNKVNLALRQTGDALLLNDGDSTSVIPPIHVQGPNEYILQMNSGFDYTLLPDYLDKALNDYGIDQPYDVMVRTCETDVLVLGFNKAALERDSVACRDRGEDLPCASVHLVFSPQKSKDKNSLASLAWLLIPVVGLGGVLLFRKKETQQEEVATDSKMKLGNFRFDAQNQKLSLGDEEFELTFRESKLLNFFATHANEVLNRDTILAAVWEDEGIVVGRSLDVFISRLRKILKADDSVSIKTVHGVGYRMEIKN